jgi:four helix bundle protein
MRKSIIADKSYHFSQRIIKCSRFLKSEFNENVISNQLLKSGMSVGANVTEGEYAQSKKDFVCKMNIALKEAAESEFWIKQLRDSGIYGDC